MVPPTRPPPPALYQREPERQAARSQQPTPPVFYRKEESQSSRRPPAGPSPPVRPPATTRTEAAVPSPHIPSQAKANEKMTPHPPTRPNFEVLPSKTLPPREIQSIPIRGASEPTGRLAAEPQPPGTQHPTDGVASGWEDEHTLDLDNKDRKAAKSNILLPITPPEREAPGALYKPVPDEEHEAEWTYNAQDDIIPTRKRWVNPRPKTRYIQRTISSF